jgi:hypothetical protein
MYWKSFKSRLGIVQVFKNPSFYEIEEICSGVPGVRSILIDKKDLYVWNYDNCSHAEMMTFIKGDNKFTMVIIALGDQITFQKATYSIKNLISKEELLEVPVVKDIIEDRKPYFFAF